MEKKIVLMPGDDTDDRYITETTLKELGFEFAAGFFGKGLMKLKKYKKLMLLGPVHTWESRQMWKARKKYMLSLSIGLKW